MSAVSCPHCEYLVATPPGTAAPTHCPSCGTRIACPRCGGFLSGAPGGNGRRRCPHCALDLHGGSTVAGDEPTQLHPTTPVIELPGFELQGELGRGGMGVVYAAIQRSLNRRVALKVLSPALAGHPEFLKRFRNEAEVAASLTNAHLLPVFDVLEAHGVPILVMPRIDGADLGHILRDRLAVRQGDPPAEPHPWAFLDDRAYLDRVLPLLDKVIAAVTAMHAGHVLHRDIKPSNVLVDERGHPWVSDFGLARFEAHGAGTYPGAAVGTVGYRSLEQTHGEEIDGRADVFSLATTAYQALTLEMPYGKAGPNRSSKPPVPPSRRQPLLGRDFDGVLLKALEPERSERYPSAAAFQDDWQRVRRGLVPRARPPGPVRRLARAARRHRWQVATAVTLVLLLLALPAVVLWNRPVAELRIVHLSTRPAGARVVLVPIDPTTGALREDFALRPDARTPLTLKHVPAGEYLIVAEVPDHGFHEVYRIVPTHTGVPDATYLPGAWQAQADGTIDLAPIDIPAGNPTGGMTCFQGGQFTMGSPHVQGSPPHQRIVAPFYLDTTEVTVAAYQLLNPRSGTGGKQEPPLDWAITYVSYDAALDYAERVGKRLPDEAEYEFAATGAGTRDFPWTGPPVAIGDWPLGPVGEPAFDHLDTQPPVYGLFSNVAEWTTTLYYPYLTDDPRVFPFYHHDPEFRKKLEGQVVRGGPWFVVDGKRTPEEWELIEPPNPKKLTTGPRSRFSVKRYEAHPGLGFRCARSAAPRFLGK
jgi:formylglycine-generating enzyme required for sulfatase activity/tRNA A-37 threonylcarbamoyl transferase component Bud32